MPFINTTIETSTLPLAEELVLQPVHPNYKKVLLIEWALTSLFLVLAGGTLIFTINAIQNSYGWMIIAAIVLFITCLHYFSFSQSFPVLAYAVREYDVAWRRGWITRSTRICPFNRVQNCSVQSGPLERRFGLASLHVYTAGTDSADIRINGIKQEEADRLRHFILGKINKENNEPA